MRYRSALNTPRLIALRMDLGVLANRTQQEHCTPAFGPSVAHSNPAAPDMMLSVSKISLVSGNDGTLSYAVIQD